MCPREDLNLHGLLHSHLKTARLPFRHPGFLDFFILRKLIINEKTCAEKRTWTSMDCSTRSWNVRVYHSAISANFFKNFKRQKPKTNRLYTIFREILVL